MENMPPGRTGPAAYRAEITDFRDFTRGVDSTREEKSLTLLVKTHAAFIRHKQSFLLFSPAGVKAYGSLFNTTLAFFLGRAARTPKFAAMARRALAPN